VCGVEQKAKAASVSSSSSSSSNASGALDGILPTLLETRKSAVDSMNQSQLDLLPGKPEVFKAVETGAWHLLSQLKV
jgi:hypothetical protein